MIPRDQSNAIPQSAIVAALTLSLLVQIGTCQENYRLTWDENGRPSCLFHSRPQFNGYSSGFNPRLVSVIRAGDAKDRSAELLVLELSQDARVIRPLKRQKLTNSISPAQSQISPSGRFYITQQERSLHPKVPRDPRNGLVIYDLMRNELTRHKFDDFFDAENKKIFAPYDPEEVRPYPKWSNGRGAFDPVHLRYYPNTPDECKSFGYPFGIIDLVDRTIRLSEPPDELPTTAVQHSWNFLKVVCVCSDDTSWHEPNLIPSKIIISITDKTPKTIRKLFPFIKQGTYKWHHQSENYRLAQDD